MSGPINFDRVMVACATTGTGTLTLGAAVPGYQAMPAAADGQLVRATVFEVDGSGIPNGAWETLIGVYTHSGTTLSRGTLMASSTGSAINFGASKRVAVSLLASSVQSTVTGTNAAATLVGGTDLEIDTSILTADRILTLPVGSPIGTVIEVGSGGNNATYELILQTGVGETCEFRGQTIAASSEITRMFISGEWVRFKKITTTKWRASERLIPQVGLLRLSTSASGETAATVVQPTSFSGVWTADINVGSVCTAASGRITTRRAAKLSLAARAQSSSGLGDGKYLDVFLYKNGTSTQITGAKYINGAAGSFAHIATPEVPVDWAVDDYVVYQWRCEEGSKGLFANTSPALPTFLSMKELL